MRGSSAVLEVQCGAATMNRVWCWKLLILWFPELRLRENKGSECLALAMSAGKIIANFGIDVSDDNLSSRRSCGPGKRRRQGNLHVLLHLRATGDSAVFSRDNTHAVDTRMMWTTEHGLH